jgi:leucyl-tRNA synthetase
VRLLAPMTPHFSEELWQRMGHTGSVFDERMPQADACYVARETFDLVIQINSKIRARVCVPAGTAAEELRQIALSNQRVKELLGDKHLQQVIVIPNKLVNIVIK